MNIKIHESRQRVLADQFYQPYFAEIKQALLDKKAKGEIIYPAGGHIFNAFELTHFEDVKVVILGQDPYHGAGQAHGLSFSVPDGVKPPPSLMNIYQEIKNDIGGDIPKTGNLESRAKQWVLLLNAILTVTAGQPASHQHIPRERFTDAVIQAISDHKQGVIFLLRWNFARSKKALIDTDKHVVLEAAHPSPFSVHKWFFGCKHFSMTNQLLAMQGKEEIKWM